MPIEIAGISLPRIHRIVTREQADFVSHRIPGLNGNVVQDMGRHSVHLSIEGIFYGATAKDDLEALRDVYKAREPVDFLAEIVGQAYFSQIIVETLEVRQAAGEPEQFSYRLTIAEYVPPPQPAAGFDTPDIDSLLELEALDFLDMIQLPDLLSVPGFGDPTAPLQSILESVGETMGSLTEPAQELSGLFGGGDDQSTAKSLRDTSGGSSLFDQINLNIDDGNILQLIQGQLNNLLSAGQSGENAQQQSTGGIGSLQSQISGLVPPNINRNNLLKEGFSAISDLLPTDASSLLGNLSGGIDSLFATLQANLVDRLGGILDNFSALKALGIGTGAKAVPSETELHPNPPPGTAPISRSIRRDISEPLSQVEELLQLLPDPLDAKSLLALLSSQLNQLPRERIPVQNLPILDELRDKLATTLLWLNGDSLSVRDNIAGSTQRLSRYIHDLFYENSLTPIRTRLEALGNSIDLTELQIIITATIAGLNDLAGRVHMADLSEADNIIAVLGNRIGALRDAGTKIQAQWLGATGSAAFRELSLLEDKLEERMADVLLLSAPSSDLSIVRFAAEKLNELLNAAGISAFIGGIHELFDAIDRLISQLNLAEIGNTVQDIVDQATGAVQSLQNLLVNVTVEFSLLVNRIEQAIADIGITELVAELKGVLEEFETTVVKGLQAVFQPVRNLLQTTFDQINGFVAAFDPVAILQPVLDLIRALTDLLSNPVLIDTIQRMKDVLNGVNTTLGKFSFRPVTSVVIDGIGVVEDAFDIVARIPMTDSIRQDVSEALKAIPATIRPATDAISEGLEEIVENGAKPVLLAIKDKPAELVEVVLQYSPDKYLGDRLSGPYQTFVSELEKLKPTTLMKPVDEALQDVLDDIREAADPSKVFSVLQGPFDTVYNAINSIDPQALIQPLQEKLTQGIHAITDRLPLDAADEAFAVVESIAGEIQKAIDAAHSIRDALISVNSRLAGLSDAENQVRQMGDEIAAKLNAVSDFAPISAALEAVEQSIDDIQATSLQQYIGDPVQSLIDRMTTLDPQNRLIALVQAQRNFPRTALEAMTDSPQKAALLTLLDDFDPMDAAFTVPLGGLQDRLDDLTKAQENLNTFFTQWQTRYHQPNGPLSRFRQKNMNLTELKTLLTSTVRQQLTDTLAPLFKVVENFQLLLSTLLGELIDLIQRLEIQANGLIQITEALEQMRETIHGLVDLLNGLDITFIAKEIQDIFDAVKAQLDAINPQHISDMLKSTFENLLDALDPDTLLGLPALDAEHQQLIGLLKQRDPKVLVTKTVQPEFDKIITFLRELDISDILTTFLQKTEDLKAELNTELDRTAQAYEDMVRAIPGDFQGSLGASLSVEVNT